MPLIPFDDRDGAIWYNGSLTPWRSAKVHVLNHGLHYGSCVFEGLRIYDGRIFELEAHAERLMYSGGVLGFTMPCTAADIQRACKDVVNTMGVREGYLRPVAWRGSEQMAVAARATNIHVAVACWDWPVPFTLEARARGIDLLTAKWRRPPPDTAPTQAKAAGLYVICTMSKHWAEDEGAHDALMLDYRGRIAESTGANIFLVQDGALHTPVPDCFLNGITRQTVIRLARKRNIKVVERDIYPDELQRTDEVFITGTAAEVTPVARIDALRFTPGEITKTLMVDYDNLVNNRAPL